MEECLVSLIIPVYNVERYLRKCLDSAVNQTLQNIEIIIVNDGSTDSSFSIVNAYAAKDTRIQVINQQNRGLSEARNVGIRIAKGEYLAFMDSDDWMDVHFLEKMYSRAQEQNADIVICNHSKVFDGGGIFHSRHHIKSDIIAPDDALRKIISDSAIKSFAWDKLYKKSLFTSNNIYYPTGLYFEDMATTFKLFYYAQKVAVVNDCLYYYLQRKTSISKKHNPKRVFDNITAIAMMRDFFEIEGVFEQYIREYQYLCVKMIIGTVWNLTVIHSAASEPGLLRNIENCLRTISSLMMLQHEKEEEQKSGQAPF